MKKVLIVNANYYDSISTSLLINCKKRLNLNKIKTSVINAPGCFEIPFLINRYIKRYDAFIALGCLIKGETPHFEFISKATFEGLIQLTIKNNKPIANGIITALNKNQAIKRSSQITNRLKTNKGIEAANAIISVLLNEPKITK